MKRSTASGPTWREYTLDELKADSDSAIAIGPFGSRMKSDCYVDVGIPVIRGTNISDTKVFRNEFVFISETKAEELAGCNVYDGDLVFPHRGSIGAVGIVTGGTTARYMLSTSLMKVTCNRKIADPLFLFYFFRSARGRYELLKNASQVGTPGIATPLTSLKAIRVPLPPLAEQQAIAEILGSLDDKIELNRRMNETLERMAQTIFKSWFVDFDPVRAKAAGRQPAGMDAATVALFPDRVEDSPLGKIPKGWRVSKLADLCSTQYGYTASAVDAPVGPKLLRVTDINKRNWIEWCDVPHCSIPQEDKTKYSLVVGDLVVARMADPGKAAIIEEPVDAIFASYLVRLKASSLAHAYVLYGYLKSDAYADYSIAARSGSVQANMNARVIVDVDIVIPPDDVIRAYLPNILPLRQRLAASVKQSTALAAIRDALLPKLLSGEIRGTDAAKLEAVR